MLKAVAVSALTLFALVVLGMFALVAAYPNAFDLAKRVLAFIGRYASRVVRVVFRFLLRILAFMLGVLARIAGAASRVAR